jgi:hypothetical protein
VGIDPDQYVRVASSDNDYVIVPNPSLLLKVKRNTPAIDVAGASHRIGLN